MCVCVPICISAFLFHLLVALIQFNFVCVMCTRIHKHTHIRDTTAIGMLKLKVKFPEKTRTYNNFRMCQTNKTNDWTKEVKGAKKKQKKYLPSSLSLTRKRYMYVLCICIWRYDSWFSFSMSRNWVIYSFALYILLNNKVKIIPKMKHIHTLIHALVERNEMVKSIWLCDSRNGIMLFIII